MYVMLDNNKTPELTAGCTKLQLRRRLIVQFVSEDVLTFRISGPAVSVQPHTVFILGRTTSFFVRPFPLKILFGSSCVTSN